MTGIEVIKPRNSKTYQGEPIAIVGPPAIGKSTVSKMVARRLKIPCYELDDIVAKTSGYTSCKILVEEKGRQYFWKIEHECLVNFFKEKQGKFIISLGGGVTSHPDPQGFVEKNRALLKKKIFTICLFPSKKKKDASTILWKRQQKDDRSHVKDEKELSTYLDERRERLLSSADRIIYTHHESAKKISDVILDLIK
ncbi:MAG: hypothetical protein ISS93_01270 [Candidatus Aenigmarchaeota archaeon]|nr:hypothetical protein [Candidatus Aenigmarchaeota archaeon]